MARLLLLLFTVFAMGFIGPSTPMDEHGERHAAVAEDACDCCPGTESEDCCTWDMGICCGQAHLAITNHRPLTSAPRFAVPEPKGDAFALDLLLPRDNGPPPTPPPIA